MILSTSIRTAARAVLPASLALCALGTIAALAPELLRFLQGGPPICTAEEGRTSLKMTLASYRSSAQNRTVRLDEMVS